MTMQDLGPNPDDVTTTGADLFDETTEPSSQAVNAYLGGGYTIEAIDAGSDLDLVGGATIALPSGPLTNKLFRVGFEVPFVPGPGNEYRQLAGLQVRVGESTTPGLSVLVGLQRNGETVEGRSVRPERDGGGWNVSDPGSAIGLPGAAVALYDARQPSALMLSLTSPCPATDDDMWSVVFVILQDPTPDAAVPADPASLMIERVTPTYLTYDQARPAPGVAPRFAPLGDGTTSIFEIGHPFNTPWPTVSVRETVPPHAQVTVYNTTTDDTVTFDFGDTVPTPEQYTAKITP